MGFMFFPCLPCNLSITMILFLSCIMGHGFMSNAALSHVEWCPCIYYCISSPLEMLPAWCVY